MNIFKANFKMIAFAWKGSKAWVICMAVNAIINSPRNLIIDVLLIGTIYNFIQEGRSFSNLLPLLAALAFFYLVNLSFEAVLFGWIRAVGSRKIDYSINKVLCENAARMPLSAYDDAEFYEEYIFALQNCSSMAKEAVENMAYFFGFILGGLISVGLIASIQPIMLVFIGVSILSSFALSSLRQKFDLQYREALAKVQVREQYIHRVFYMKDYAKELRSLPGLKDLLLDKFAGIEKENMVWARKYGRKNFLLGILGIFNNDVLMYWLIMLLTVGIIWWTGKVSPGDLLIMTTSVATAALLIRTIVNYIPVLKKTKVYYEKLTAFLERAKSQFPKQHEDSIVLEEVESICFDHVTFTYPHENHPVLRDVSFSVHRGEALAIVGLNGAGKSTILKLMLKFYLPDSGCIYVNGIDLAKIDEISYRKLFGCVFQEVNLYAMSARINIAMGNENRNKLEQIITATGLSNQFPDAEDLERDMTREFSQDGLVFSGGNAQKMAIARALYQDASVLLLDEITSAVDPETEQEIMTCITRIRKDKLTVMISHKLSCVKEMDRIIVLSDGRIAETGSHTQLIAQKGVYYGLFKIQAEQFVQTSRQENLEREAWL